MSYEIGLEQNVKDASMLRNILQQTLMQLWVCNNEIKISDIKRNCEAIEQVLSLFADNLHDIINNCNCKLAASKGYQKELKNE
jgi:hypothetical protein